MVIKSDAHVFKCDLYKTLTQWSTKVWAAAPSLIYFYTDLEIKLLLQHICSQLQWHLLNNNDHLQILPCVDHDPLTPGQSKQDAEAHIKLQLSPLPSN